MRKNKLLVIGCGLLILGLAGCAGQNIKNVDSKGTNIVCYGDSITFGYGADAGQDYPSWLAKKIAFTVINAGVDGDNSAEGLARINADVLGKGPLLVIIEFGGNDFLGGIPLEATVNNIKEMVDKIQAKGAMAAIVDISAGMLFRNYRRQFSKIAREKGAIFIPDVLSGIITNAGLKSDFFHPNDKGYDLIAERIYRAILPFLKENTIIRQAKI